MEGDEFAALLRELKERSGLSYGVLGKRLHLSGSTLHRYVNGDAVPLDYAPVERFARMCGATPEELVELHRRWVRADVMRQRKGPAAEQAAPSSEASGSVPGNEPVPADESTSDSESRSDGAPEPTAPGGRRLRRRTGALAAVGVAAAAVSVALVVNLLPGDADGDNGGGQQAVGATGATGPTRGESPSGAPADITSGPPTGSTVGSPQPGAADTVKDGMEPTVVTNPYKWEGPCSQHYLIDRNPAQVPPPPTEQDARGWVTAIGGVAGQDQLLALTVQGTSKETIVLEALHVRVVDQAAPLAWNDYVMGVGCGGEVNTKAFDVDLDARRPVTVPKAGQRAFPYKVSESDPEVFYVTAHAMAHDVRWYLELDWSSGDRRGTVRISDNGQPFRTSANAANPAFMYPLGSSAWEKAPDEEG